jgi:catechol 2,3-dioxygenase-like lactoylglutathione lyase family enzyme
MENLKLPDISLAFLDHVALRVADLERSASWYGEVLSLQRCQLPEWGDFPIFMLAGKSGVALFPALPDHPGSDAGSGNIKIDHFAFHVSRENFKKALKRYQALGLAYEVKDHHYFHSVYTRDPDGHTVELTTLVVAESEFYKPNA